MIKTLRKFRCAKDVVAQRSNARLWTLPANATEFVEVLNQAIQRDIASA
jgi:hypothetical protein